MSKQKKVHEVFEGSLEVWFDRADDRFECEHDGLGRY